MNAAALATAPPLVRRGVPDDEELPLRGFIVPNRGALDSARDEGGHFDVAHSCPGRADRISSSARRESFPISRANRGARFRSWRRPLLRSLPRLLFGISVDETRFERRGFRGGKPEVRERLEAIGRAFLTGYHAALEVVQPERLPDSLRHVDSELSGFAYEGAAMGFALLDTLMPWGRGRWQSFLAGCGAPHAYMVHVGAGWATARLGGRPERFVSRENPLLRWLVLDGLGFHEGYFHWPRTVEARQRPNRLDGYSLRAFDQGLGRSLWFIDGGDPSGIARTIATFEPQRRSDLWAGVGLAAAYAGGVDPSELEILRSAAGPFLPQVAQGAAFAAQARQRAANPALSTNLACEILCGMSSSEAAQLTELSMRDLAPEEKSPDYEVWRRRIQNAFVFEAEAAHV